MDLTRTIGYRGFALNTVQFDAVSRDMVGCEVRSVEYGSVLGVGYEEKRAMADGTDVADLFLGKRLISMSGAIYGRTRPEAFQKWMQMVDLLTPTDAYESWPSQRGYAPLDFYLPTPNLTDFPTGLIHAYIAARPMATPTARFDSDVHGGDDNKALAIPWSAQFDARVPDIVNYDYTIKSLSGIGSQEFSMRNRGNRPATVEVVIIAPASFNNGSTGSVSIRIGGSQFKITVPHSTSNQIIRYDTHAKVLTQWSHGALRMDLLTRTKGVWHPKMPAGTVSVGWHRGGTKALLAGSYIRFRDTFA